MSTAVARKTTKRRRPAAARSRAEAAPSLRELQERFQSAILAGDDAILADILDNSRTGRDTLFGVYKNAYVGRLVEVLSNDHEVLRRHVGEEYFHKLAQAYVAAHPSRTQNARWFSRHLPSFLRSTEPYNAHPHLAELAALEQMLSNAFDVDDAVILQIADLAAFPPEDWTSLCFRPHPSSARADFSTNAYPLWSKLKEDLEAPPPEALAEPQQIIVWRRAATPVARVLGPEEAMLWDEAAKGVRFGVLCELAATYDDPDNAALRVAQYLQGWIMNGMLQHARIDTD